MQRSGRELRRFTELQSAKESLAGILPPQPEKILGALQNVERALHYADIKDGADKCSQALRDALRALNLIEDRDKLPPAIRAAISAALSQILTTFRELENGSSDRLGRPGVRTGLYDGPERRGKQPSHTQGDSPRRRSDDTQDAWERLEEEL